MKRLLIITTLLGFSAFIAEAQLLEDTDKKLKIKKVDRKRFIFFRGRKKMKRIDGVRFDESKSSPRYSSARNRIKTHSASVKSSEGNPFREGNYRTSPRYSKDSPFRSNAYNASPRYSRGIPLRGRYYRISPRYSKIVPFAKNKANISVRYSIGMPFRGGDYRINPRYSHANPFRGMKYSIVPRYSTGMPFRNKDYDIKPHYSGSKISIFKQKKWNTANYHHKYSLWEGDIKVSRKASGDQHPSSNYHFATKFQNPQIRKMLRQWNIFLTRLNGNKQNSKGVKKPVEKPKFDKKERVIWNN